MTTVKNRIDFFSIVSICLFFTLQGLMGIPIVCFGNLKTHFYVSKFSKSVESSSPLNISTQIISPSCSGQYGLLTILAQGGQPPYSYFANGININPSSNLLAGTYTITVTDFVQNSIQTQISIIQPTPLNVQICSSPPACIACNTPLYVTPSGGTPPYSIYVGGQQGISPFLLAQGTYNIIVEDANACSFSTNYKVSKPITKFSKNNLGVQGDDEQKNETDSNFEHYLHKNFNTVFKNEIADYGVNIHASPNPFSQQLHVEFDNKLINAKKVYVLDINGRLIWNSQLMSVPIHNILSIPTSMWPSGMYILLIQTEKNTTAYKKIIKK